MQGTQNSFHISKIYKSLANHRTGKRFASEKLFKVSNVCGKNKVLKFICHIYLSHLPQNSTNNEQLNNFD